MFNTDKIGILVGAAPLGAEKKLLLRCIKSGDFVSVAADDGLSFFMENRVAPSFWVGDGDSLGEDRLIEAVEMFPRLSIRPVPPEKDDTDMRLGMEKCILEGADIVCLFGAFGGERIDHTIANLQLMHEFACKGTKTVGVEENSFSFVLTAGQSVHFGEEEEGLLSVFALSENCNIKIQDLYYEYDGPLSNKRAIGVSNTFDKKGGTITVRRGELLVVRNKPLKSLDEIPEIG